MSSVASHPRALGTSGARGTMALSPSGMHWPMGRWQPSCGLGLASRSLQGRRQRVCHCTPPPPSAWRGGRLLASAASPSSEEGTVPTADRNPALGILSLKEWALACAALQEGDQTVLLRKGGLKDPCFEPEGSAFVLFPTAFHNTRQLVTQAAASKYSRYLDFELGEELEVKGLCTLTGCWTTRSPEVLELTSDFHVWSDGLLSTRMKWKPTQPLTVMELRCWKLNKPLKIPMSADYKGCFSWVHLQAETSVGELFGNATPVLDDREFKKRQQKLRDQLAVLDDLAELPIPTA